MGKESDIRKLYRNLRFLIISLVIYISKFLNDRKLQKWTFYAERDRGFNGEFFMY